MQDYSKVDRLSYERNIDLQEILFRECNQADDQNISPQDEKNEVETPKKKKEYKPRKQKDGKKGGKKEFKKKAKKDGGDNLLLS